MLNLFQHPVSSSSAAENWTLKQVQGDGSHLHMRIDLQPHPDTPGAKVTAVGVEVTQSRRNLLTLWYTVYGDVAELVIPPPAEPLRTSGLWESTCFELFVRSGTGDSYDEFNFSPSTQWAAYSFRGYREGMAPAPVEHEPIISRIEPLGSFELHVSLPIRLPRSGRLGLSAVIQEKGGRKSYWALAHPRGDPDFHDPACFALQLPAAGQV
jgi:hypothetical protein